MHAKRENAVGPVVVFCDRIEEGLDRFRIVLCVKCHFEESLEEGFSLGFSQRLHCILVPQPSSELLGLLGSLPHAPRRTFVFPVSNFPIPSKAKAAKISKIAKIKVGKIAFMGPLNRGERF